MTRLKNLVQPLKIREIDPVRAPEDPCDDPSLIQALILNPRKSSHRDLPTQRISLHVASTAPVARR